jgi:hypothetical protein
VHATDITIEPYQHAARVTWKIRSGQQDSSYITNVIICLNGTKCQTKARGENETTIDKIEPYTWYNVQIETQDGSFQKSKKTSKSFKTKEAGRHIYSLYIL